MTDNIKSDSLDGKPFRYIPKTGIGKALLMTYLIAFFSIMLMVTGFVFAEPQLFGPLAGPAAWMYIWLAVMNGVLIINYVYLFKPWAESAEALVKEEAKDWDFQERKQQAPGETLFGGGDD